MRKNASVSTAQPFPKKRKTVQRTVACGPQKTPPPLSRKKAEGVVVLVSGRGSNLRAILEHPKLRGKVSAVFSNNPQAPALDIAAKYSVPARCINPTNFPNCVDFERGLRDAIEECSPKMVALAGFMHVLGAEFVSHFRGRLVNIHPSLLPKFRGLDTHYKAIRNLERLHGCTVHWVDEKVDAGEPIRQSAVEVDLLFDSPEALAAKVLEKEHKLYPDVIAKLLLNGKITV